jgi:two-component system, chemotaxis family, response regulator Rcp1
MNRRLRVLLIEDNPADADLAIDALRQNSSQVDMSVANDGVQALERLQTDDVGNRPDIVLLDLNLPRLDGRDVLVSMRADERLRAIPVIILTSSEADRDILDSYRLGANCFITKPVDLQLFRSVIRELVGFWFETATLPRMVSES